MTNQTITLNRVEYETKTHDFNKMLSEIKIPKGWRLWTAEECIKVFNSHEKELNLSDCWFFIEHPFDKFKDKYGGRFWADSVGASLYCGRGAVDRHDTLGVRFAKDLKVSNKKSKNSDNEVRG